MIKFICRLTNHRDQEFLQHLNDLYVYLCNVQLPSELDQPILPSYSSIYLKKQGLIFIISISLQPYIVVLRVSNRNSIARKCTKLCATVLKLRGILSNCAQFLEVWRARNCAQVKSTCVGNPSIKLPSNLSSVTLFSYPSPLFGAENIFQLYLDKGNPSICE